MVVGKATATYSIMVVALVGGLWVILAIGSTLLPPPDLAGKWELTGGAGRRQLWVEQSGRFVDLSMDNWKGNLKIVKDAGQDTRRDSGRDSGPDSGPDLENQTSVVMVGGSQRVTFANMTLNDCSIRFDGSSHQDINGTYHAHRVQRYFH